MNWWKDFMPRKAIQARLPFPEVHVLTPAAGRSEPVVWVRRIVLWHDVSQPCIRDVELRRGLNIIWSPVGDDPNAVASGHAAGKTLFCRLIRYCLGEDSFADPDDTAVLRDRYPNGAVGAEVRIRGESWVVRRRFALPRDDRAAKAESIDQLAADENGASFAEFMAALQSAIFDDESRYILDEMPDVKEPWQYLLAWLTRDQECRIDGLTHWRHPDSSSHSPVQNVKNDTRLQVLRIVLGLYSKHASDLRKNIADVSSRAKSAETTRQKIQARFLSLQEELATALELDLERIWPPPVALLQSEELAREAHRHELLARADERIRAVAVVTSNPDQLRDTERLSQMEGKLARLAEQAASLAAEVKREQARVELLDIENAKSWGKVREAKHPVCPYDDTPLDVEASKFACPLVRLPDPAAAKRIAEETMAAWQAAQVDLRQKESELQSIREEHASLDVKAKTLAKNVDARNAATASQTSASQAAWAAKGLVRRLFEVRAQLDEALRVESAEKKELKARQDEQVAGLPDYSTARLSRWFDVLVQRIVAPEATGSVKLDGNGLHPNIDWRGTRRSVALNSLQVVLFDLAAMLCAVEGDSRAPAFLVHDSPREGDLDPWTYGRIFQVVLDLGPDEDAAPFQYIITTTTDPPDGRVRARVRLEIGADTEERRLFQADL